MAKITVTCGQCKRDFVLTVDTGRYGRWRLGEGTIQRMLPELTADERELLMTGNCGECFDKLCDQALGGLAGGDHD